MWLFFSCTISFVPNFRILTQEVAEKSLMEKKSLQTDRQTNKQTDKQHNYRKGKNYIPPIYFVPGYKQIREANIISLIQHLCGCFFLTQYNSSLSSFVPNFRILTQVVAEKSLTEKKKFTDRHTNQQTDRQTNIITEKAKTINPLYTSYRGYNNASNVTHL